MCCRGPFSSGGLAWLCRAVSGPAVGPWPTMRPCRSGLSMASANDQMVRSILLTVLPSLYCTQNYRGLPHCPLCTALRTAEACCIAPYVLHSELQRQARMSHVPPLWWLTIVKTGTGPAQFMPIRPPGEVGVRSSKRARSQCRRPHSVLGQDCHEIIQHIRIPKDASMVDVCVVEDFDRVQTAQITVSFFRMLTQNSAAMCTGCASALPLTSQPCTVVAAGQPQKTA